MFGLKAAIPAGGTTIEVMEDVSSEDSDGKVTVEAVLYVQLPEGHPVITASLPFKDTDNISDPERDMDDKLASEVGEVPSMETKTSDQILVIDSIGTDAIPGMFIKRM